MMRFAAEAAKHLPRAEIVELHHETKVDAPSGTAKATAEAMGGDVPIHSVRLPGIVAHQEVLLSEPGELLTIRHDAFSREAYVPGVLLALERLSTLPARADRRIGEPAPDAGVGWPVLGEVLTAIVTPFDKDGAVDYDRFRALARHVIDSGADGLVVAATTGESPTLTDDEKLELWAASVDEVGERATVIASTGTYSTAHSVHLTEQAHELGVDGFLVVTPYYNKPPPRGIVEHFKAVAAASDKPIIVYNIPQRVVVNIEPETMLELAEIPTVKAVKQATEELDQARRIVDETGLDLYAGSDHLVYPFLEVGGVGGVVVHGNLVPGRVKEMIRLHNEGDTDGARRIDEELKPLVDVLGVTINPIPVKAALNLLGHEVGGLRLPLVEASDEELAEIRSVLERVGLTAPARV